MAGVAQAGHAAICQLLHYRSRLYVGINSPAVGRQYFIILASTQHYLFRFLTLYKLVERFVRRIHFALLGVIYKYLILARHRERISIWKYPVQITVRLLDFLCRFLFAVDLIYMLTICQHIQLLLFCKNRLPQTAFVFFKTELKFVFLSLVININILFGIRLLLAVGFLP